MVVTLNAASPSQETMGYDLLSFLLVQYPAQRGSMKTNHNQGFLKYFYASAAIVSARFKMAQCGVFDWTVWQAACCVSSSE
jgi:hypothetical protein